MQQKEGQLKNNSDYPLRSISLTHVIATVRKFLIYELFHIIMPWNGLWKWHGFFDKSTGFEKCSSCIIFIHTMMNGEHKHLRVENLCEKTLKLAIYQVDKLCLVFSWLHFSSAWPTRMILVTFNNFFMSIDFQQKKKKRSWLKLEFFFKSI